MGLNAEVILDYLVDQVGLDREGLTTTTALFSSGLLDSLVLMELIAFVEKAGGFKVRWNEVSLDHFDSVDQILAFAAARG